jgi:hypothetical protein
MSAGQAALAALLLSGCSAATPRQDLPPAPCDASAYPCGPYGARAGDVVEDLSFQAFADPQHLCREPAELRASTAGLRPLAFSDWFRGDPACPGKKKRLLWIMVGAGWCPACLLEAQRAQRAHADGTLDRRVALYSVLFETDVPGSKVSEPFLRTWIATLGLSFPVGMDPDFALGRFFRKEHTPFNMLLEVATMRSVYQHAGSDSAGLDAAIRAALE